MTCSRRGPLSRLRLALWVVLAVVAARPSALAQEPPLAPSEYDRALDQALTFHAQHDYESAREFMERAHAIEPSARTLRGLGIVAFAQGQPLVALRYLDQALASDVKPLPIDLQTSVEQLRTQIWSQVGRYEIHVEPTSAELSLDGAALDFYAPNTVVLEPGVYTLSARAQDRSNYSIQLEAKPGARETLHIVLALPPPSHGEQLAVRPSSSRSDAPPSRPWWTPKLRYTGIAVGGALLLGGVGLWTAGWLRLDRVVEACEDMPSGTCTTREAGRLYEREKIKALGISSAVLAGTGAVLLTSVAAMEISAWRRRGQRVYAALGLRSFNVRIAF